MIEFRVMFCVYPISDMAGAAKKPAKKAVQTVKHKELKNPLIARGIRKFSNAQVS